MRPELWGGIECTVNRVGRTFFDQIDRTGHARRPADLDSFAGMGIQTLRYPVLWERVQPVSPDQFDWAWSDGRLARLRELGIRPIVALLHHGSGPRWTDLLDPEFPFKFARFAGAVARRYPWVDAYTPINEPLTTARFSGLYGHWHPHRKDDRSFFRMLVNQIRGTTLAMAAIRKEQPAAQLIQTEDLGKVYGTPLLRYQVDFENERRWLVFDLLAGRFTPGHPLWNYAVGIGGDPVELMELAAHPCPADIYGIDHYITSERFLDHRTERYPPQARGGNGRHPYADVAAVRVADVPRVGLAGLLSEFWERYRAPAALTEVHLGCTREEQLRWLIECWETGSEAIENGIDLRAVTAWALLGSCDWNSLVTRFSGDYEPGAFDVRSAEPRPTAIAQAARALAETGSYRHPVLETKGWWRRPARLFDSAGRIDPCRSPEKGDARPILIFGADGMLGRALCRVCAIRGLSCAGVGRGEADVTDAESVRSAFALHRPWAAINAARFFCDDNEGNADLCFAVNAEGAGNIASAAAEHCAKHVYVSCGSVFGGSKPGPYFEDDPVSPCGAYGESKARGEERVLAAGDGALVVRAAMLFSPWSFPDFAEALLDGPAALDLPDVLVSPAFCPDFCNALLDLLIDGESGVWHLANDGHMPFVDFADAVLKRIDLPAWEIRRADPQSFARPHPSQIMLASRRGSVMPPLQKALARYRPEFAMPLMNQCSERA